MEATQDIQTDSLAIDTPPSAETIKKISEYPVLDHQGEKHTFESLYGPSNPRVLIVFIRHFFCGSCREFICALSKIKPTDLQKLPIPTSIVIIGQGDPGLIDSYTAQTQCPFPIYTDPSANLYTELGMVRNIAMGARPEYFRKSMVRVVAESVVNMVKHLGTGLVTKGGAKSLNGAEFLFETGEDGVRVTWCHRMTDSRNHTGMTGLRKVLDPEGLILGEKA